MTATTQPRADEPPCPCNGCEHEPMLRRRGYCRGCERLRAWISARHREADDGATRGE